MDRPRLHLTAPAGSCRKFLEQMELGSPGELIALVQDAVGPDYLVTGDEALIGAEEDEWHGGRQDDQRRAADLQQALADSEVAAIVTLRGGSWFTRILPSIDFSVIERRERPVAVFGFSELTTLVNIVGAHRLGLGVYDMSPAFLPYGLRRLAPSRKGQTAETGESATFAETAAAWVKQRLRPEFERYFRDVVSMISGRGSSRTMTARLLRGRLDDRTSATFVGGNLCVLTTLLGSPFREAVTPRGRWVVLEELNEPPYRLDRFLAHLTLAGFWEECAGVLLGDCHMGDTDYGPALEALLDRHLPGDRAIPVLASRQIGHVWPMAPLPLHTELSIERTDEDRYSIHWPGELLRMV